MLQQLKVSTIQLSHSPRAKTIIIFSMILLAALAGGAPNDVGGGG